MRKIIFTKEEKETICSFLCAVAFCAVMFFVIVLNSILTN